MYPYLIILVPIKLKHFSFGDEPLKEGETVAVQCVISSGDLPANMSWMFNGRALNADDNAVVTKTSSKIISLTIESVTAKNAGNYTCVGQNIVGESSYTSRLYINGWLL